MLETLRRIVSEFNNAPDLLSGLARTVKQVRDAMGTEVCSVYLYDDETERFVLMATEGLKPEAIGVASLDRKQGLVGTVAERGEPLNLEDAFTHPKFHYMPEVGEDPYHAFLGVPIMHQAKVLGVIIVQQMGVRRFDQSEEAFLVTVSAQLAAALAHARVVGAFREKKKAQKDGLRPLPSAIFRGLGSSSGVAIGEAYVIVPEADLESVEIAEAENPAGEISRIESALIAVRTEIRRISEAVGSRLKSQEKALFEVYLRLLDKNALGGDFVDAINKQNLRAESAVKVTVDDHVARFMEMEDAYLRERAADITDIGSRVLSKLSQGSRSRKPYPDNAILIADELTATLMLEAPQDRICALVSRKGSINSHLSVMARALSLPTVVGCSELPIGALHGSAVIVDGFSGRVIINPNGEYLEQYQRLMAEERALEADLLTQKDLPAVTLDEHRIELLVNAGLPADAQRGKEYGAEGVGLYRSEIPFMVRERFPSEEEQRAVYREMLEAYAPAWVTIRTLDIGGDKSLSYFPIEEKNPFLGWRGVRVTLDHPELFMSQLRAMLKAAIGLNNLQILLPMVSTVFEIEECLSLIERAHRELREEGFAVSMPRVGAMVEVPAAVYQADDIARRVDFLSVGSNDLIQYLLAVDRNNPRVADLYHGFHPAVIRALMSVVEAAHAQNKKVSICGELAGEPAAIVLLLAMGFDALSMSPSQLLKAKWVVRSVSQLQARKLLAEARQMDNSAVIKAYMELQMDTLGLGNLVRKGFD